MKKLIALAAGAVLASSLAVGAMAAADESYDRIQVKAATVHGVSDPSLAVDGDVNTAFVVNLQKPENYSDQYIVFDLGSNTSIGKIVINRQSGINVYGDNAYWGGSRSWRRL